MNLKRYISLFVSLIVLMLLFSISTASVTADSAATLQVNILRYDPAPAEIGEYVDVWVKIENVGFGKADDVSIEFEPEYPFSLDSPNNALENFGILSPDRSAVHKYRLYVDDNAKQGTGTVTIRYQADEGLTWYEEEFDLRVGSDTFDSRGTVQLEDVNTNPDVLMPGDTGTVSFTMKNTASQRTVTIDEETYDTNARVQMATLHSCDDITVTSDPYQGDGLLGPGDSMELSYNIEVSEDAEEGTCYLDLAMMGSSHTFNNNWRIPVKIDSSSVKVIPSKPLIIENGEGTLEFDVANVRPNDLSSVNIELQADGVEFSPSPYFIGSMSPDELFTIETDTSVTSDNITGTRELTIIANYQNGMNEHERVVAVRELKLATTDDQGSNLALIGGVLVLIVGAIAVVMYRRRKNNKNQ